MRTDTPMTFWDTDKPSNADEALQLLRFGQIQTDYEGHSIDAYARTERRMLNAADVLERELSAQCGGWISVKDRLPQIYQRVLLHAENDEYIRVGEYLGHKTFSAESGYPVLGQFCPTRWQPLPPPPKG